MAAWAKFQKVDDGKARRRGGPRRERGLSSEPAAVCGIVSLLASSERGGRRAAWLARARREEGEVREREMRKGEGREREFFLKKKRKESG